MATFHKYIRADQMKKLFILSFLFSLLGACSSNVASADFYPVEDKRAAARLCAVECNINLEQAKECREITRGEYLTGECLAPSQRRCFKSCIILQKRQFEEMYAN